MTDAQRETLLDLCRRYRVPFRESDYLVSRSGTGLDSPAGWVEGWVGGVGTTIYVGVDPQGRPHS